MKNRFGYLFLIMVATSLIVVFSTISINYFNHIDQIKEKLHITAKGLARLMEAVAAYDIEDQKHHHKKIDPFKATLSQIIDAHKKFRGFGETGEITLAMLKNNKIAFLLEHRHPSTKKHTIDGPRATPMKKALQGLSGTEIGVDYRGERVVAAYEPVAVLNLGIVSKMDLSEIQRPFIHAALYSLLVTFVIVLLATVLFRRISSPVLGWLQAQNITLERKVLKKSKQIIDSKKELQSNYDLLEVLQSELTEKNLILNTVHETLNHFIREKNPLNFYKEIVSSILKLTDSEYAMFVECKYSKDNSLTLVPLWSATISSDKKVQDFFKNKRECANHIHSLDNLMGTTLSAQEEVICNNPDPQVDSRCRGVPANHPKLENFLGLSLSYQNKNIGIIGVANKKGGYDKKLVKFLRPLVETATYTLMAILNEKEKELLEKELKENYQTQMILNKILTIALAEEKLESILQQVMDSLLSNSSFAFEKKGCIFLTTEDGETMKLVVQTSLPKILQEKCKYVSKGQCVCGKALESGKTSYCSHVDEDHTTTYEGMADHGHYSTPIIFGDKVLGVISVYLKAGHQKKQNEVDFLENIASTVAGLIVRYKARSDLKSLNRELETRVKERTHEMEMAKIDAENSNKAKSNFLASMSHELRTPLNSILGFNSLLDREYYGELNDKQKQYVKNIDGSGNHLLELINDILDLAKIESGKSEMNFELIDLKELLEESFAIMEEKATSNQLTLDCITDPALEKTEVEIEADARRIKQIIFNLISNAIKFTPPEGKITCHLQFETESKDNPVYRISVSDTGAGIGPEHFEKVFDKFAQVQDELSDKAQGTGLGLPITKKLVEMHGGKIWLESEGKGKGCTFNFTLPKKVPTIIT